MTSESVKSQSEEIIHGALALNRSDCRSIMINGATPTTKMYTTRRILVPNISLITSPACHLR